jgi:hypothetical protein
VSKARPSVICVKNYGYEVSLELRKIYIAVPDADAEQHGLRRVIDESGEDYLYPGNFFVEIALPQPVRKAVLTAA